ncbi:hypothetical protein FACS1894182_10730 [Bacteroidia bacterium]|nr:hypothetical protein FACS1894182_10730 [Bacteroidia bacterium]
MKQTIIFEIMVIYVEILEREITDYNRRHGTDFEIIEMIDDEVIFCKIKVAKYEFSDIYNLGYSVSVLLHTLKAKGEID